MSITIHKNALCVVKDRDENRVLGTGFSFLNYGWFVTAKHVVLADELPRKSLKLIFVDGETATCRVVAVHPELDLALLQQDGDPLCETPLMPGHHEYINQEGLYYAGYSPRRSKRNRSTVEINHIRDYKIEHRERKNREKLLTFPAEYAEGGNSGGPILGAGGAVVAVIIQKFFEGESTFCRATDINVLLEGLTYNQQWII